MAQIPFVFGNTEQQLTPLGNSTVNLKLSNLVIRMWTSFAYDLDPNGHGGKSFNYGRLVLPADTFSSNKCDTVATVWK